MLVMDTASRQARRHRCCIDTPGSGSGTNPGAKYGKIWLIPYHTNKGFSAPGDPPRPRRCGSGELIVSRQDIADPGAASADLLADLSDAAERQVARGCDPLALSAVSTSHRQGKRGIPLAKILGRDAKCVTEIFLLFNHPRSLRPRASGTASDVAAGALFAANRHRVRTCDETRATPPMVSFMRIGRCALDAACGDPPQSSSVSA